jgi:uncharacterized protein (DUF1778 family)
MSIDRAPDPTDKGPGDLALDAARRASEDALLDRAQFGVSPKAHAAILARLDMPPQPNQRLRRALTSAAPWD